jgi:hypothetical protein
MMSPDEQSWIDANVYLTALEWECHSFHDALSAAEQCFADRQQRAGFTRLHSAITFAANVSKMLWPRQPPGRGAAARARGERLRLVLEIEHEPALTNVSLRNALEHIDERIDTWVENSPNHNFTIFSLGPANMIAGIRIEDVFFSYDPAQREVRMLGDNIDIYALEASIRRVLAGLKRYRERVEAERRGTRHQL